MTDLPLGKLITSDDAPSRDAIHIAVAAVTAGQNLEPGDRVILDPEMPLTVLAAMAGDKEVGIVDPFITRTVFAGERFYLFLAPNTITGLRHQWSHPAFPVGPSETKQTTVEASKEWIADFAMKNLGYSYDRLMGAAHAYVDYGDYEYDNSETYKGVDFEEFWKHFEIVTGKRPEDTYAPYTCSC